MIPLFFVLFLYMKDRRLAGMSGVLVAALSSNESEEKYWFVIG